MRVGKYFLTFEQGAFFRHKPEGSEKISVRDAVMTASRDRSVSPKAKKIISRLTLKRYTPPASLPKFLDTHQVDGVRWLLSRSRSYLAHAPGAGKTLEAILGSLLAHGSGQVVFIVPPTATANWEREIAKWDERLGVFRTVSTIRETAQCDMVDWGADILIVPHSMLTKTWVLLNLALTKKKFLAVDEASAFKDHTAERTIALFGGTLKSGGKCPGMMRNARIATLLDGSPMPNRPIELWVPTTAMCPAAIDFMTYDEFGQHFCGATQNERGNWEYKFSSNEDELRSSLQKDFMHVVTEDALTHPERLRKMVWMNTDPRTPAMKTWDRKHLASIDFRVVNERKAQGELATARAELGMKKIPWVARYAEERLVKNESILLFAWHRDVVLGLAKRLARHDPGVVLGGTSERDREQSFAKFQSGKCKLLILNIASGGRIHNLTRAERVIFGEFSWTDETNKQAEKRTSRKGNDRARVPCDYVIAPGTLDERVAKALFMKEKRIKRIIG